MHLSILGENCIGQSGDNKFFWLIRITYLESVTFIEAPEFWTITFSQAKPVNNSGCSFMVFHSCHQKGANALILIFRDDDEVRQASDSLGDG